MNLDTFYRPPIASVRCNIGTKNYADAATLLNSDDDDSSEGSVQNKECLRALTEDDILKPHISDQDFRSTNVNAAGEATNFGYNLHVFNIRYQKTLEAAPPIRTEFKFFEDVPAVVFAYALVLTKKLVGISNQGQRHFDLI